MITKEQLMKIKPGDKLYDVVLRSGEDLPRIINGTIEQIAGEKPRTFFIKEGEREIIDYLPKSVAVAFAMTTLSVNEIDAWKQYLEGCRASYRSRQKEQIELGRLMIYASNQIPEKHFSTFHKQCNLHGLDIDRTSPFDLACIMISKKPKKTSMYDLGKAVFGDITLHQMAQDHGQTWPSKAIWQIIRGH